MHQIVYVSMAEPLAENGLEEIVLSARRRNPERQINGFLLYNGRNFLQLIEGPRQALMALMRDLASDRRHSGIVKLVEKKIDGPNCSDWAMHHFEWLDSREDRLAVLDRELPPGIGEESLKVARNFAALN